MLEASAASEIDIVTKRKKSVTFDDSVIKSSEDKTQEELNIYRRAPNAKKSPSTASTASTSDSASTTSDRNRIERRNSPKIPVVLNQRSFFELREGVPVEDEEMRQQLFAAAPHPRDLRIQKTYARSRPSRKSSGPKREDDDKKDLETEMK